MIRYTNGIKSNKRLPSIHKKSKLFSLVAVFFMVFHMGNAQDLSQYIIPVQGSYDESKDMSLSWTIGDHFIHTIDLDDIILTQGFQQAQIKIRNIPSPELAHYKMLIHPNPTSAILKLSALEELGPFILELFDISGKRLIHERRMESSSELDLSPYPQGKYILRISDTTTLKHSLFEIIKI